MGYHWHLRALMAAAGMFATTDLVPLLAERGVTLSREQVYRLVARVPERLSLTTLAALCDILSCSPADLIEPYRATRPGRPRRPGGRHRPGPTRARVLPAPRPLNHRLTPTGWLPSAAARGAAPRCRRPDHRPLSRRPGNAGSGAADAVERWPATRRSPRSLAAALAADPTRVDGRRATGGRPAGRRAAGPRARTARADLRRCGRTGRPLTRSAAGGVCARCRRRQLAERLHPLRGGQTGRRPGRAGPAVLRPVRRPTATALRTVRTDPADRPPRPRRAARHLRCLLPGARGGLQPLRAPPAVFVRVRRRQPDLRRLRPARTAPSARTAAPTGHRPPAGPRDRSATPATPRRCAAAATAPAAVPAAPGRPTRPGRHHLRRLRRRCPPPSRLHRLRDRGQALRTRPLRTLRAAPPHRELLRAGADADPPRPGAGLRGDHHHRRPTHRAELAAQRRRRRVLAEMASGTTACTHEALDAHPRRRAAGYLRAVLVANQVLPARDEQLAAAERFLARHPGRHQPRTATVAWSTPTPPGRSCAASGATRGTDRPAPHPHQPRPHQHQRRRSAC